eukprot:4116112-Amphidinium_carterae.1
MPARAREPRKRIARTMAWEELVRNVSRVPAWRGVAYQTSSHNASTGAELVDEELEAASPGTLDGHGNEEGRRGKSGSSANSCGGGSI